MAVAGRPFFSLLIDLLTHTHIQHHLLGVQAPHADPSPRSGDAASKDDPMDDDDDDDAPPSPPLSPPPVSPVPKDADEDEDEDAPPPPAVAPVEGAAAVRAVRASQAEKVDAMAVPTGSSMAVASSSMLRCTCVVSGGEKCRMAAITRSSACRWDPFSGPVSMYFSTAPCR